MVTSVCEARPMDCEPEASELYREFHRRPRSRATMGSYSVCAEEDDKRSQSLATRGTYSVFSGYERRFQSGSAMGRILLVMMLLAALAALVVGAVKVLVWLVHLCGAVHVPISLADSWDSATAWVMLVILVVGISLALLVLLYCGLWAFGFMDYGIAFGSYAAMWMSSIGNVVSGSLYSLLQMIAAGGISVFTVLLYIAACVVLVVGAFEIIVWLVHSGAIHAPTWLVDSLDSATAWVLRAWDSFEIFGWWYSFVAWLHNIWDSATAWVLHAWDSFEIFGWWYSFVAWLHKLWESITDHHKWKIYT